MKRSVWSGLRVAGIFLAALACRAAEPAVSVANVAARQRYPWNGLVDIDFEVQYSDASADIFILFTANDRQAGEPLPVKTLSLAGATFTNGISTVRAGKYRATWDAGRGGRLCA